MSRVAKTDPRLVAYADVDEANSVHRRRAGARRRRSRTIADLLRSIQNDLFDVGADLCTPITPDPEYPPLRITAAYTERLEAACDEYNEALPKLTSFILPGGTAGRGAAAPGAGGRPAGRAQRVGAARRRRRAHQRRDRPLPQPAVGPAVHPGPHRQPRRRRPVGAGRAQRRARPAGGARAERCSAPAAPTPPRTGSRSPSSGPSPAPAGPPAVRAGQDDDVRRAARGRPGRALRRDSHPELRRGRAARCGRTDRDSPRYQSSMSPPYQATPTDQRGDRTGPQPHGDRAEAGEQEPAAQQEGHDHDRRRSDAEQDQQDRGHGASAAGGSGQRISGGSGVLAGGPQPGLGAAGGVERLRVVATPSARRSASRARCDVDLGGDLRRLGEDGDARAR